MVTETTVTVGGRAELHDGGPTSSVRREKGAAMGPMTALRVWGSSFFSLHMLPLFPQSTEHCFPWSQVRGAVREASPITLANITREGGFPLGWGNVDREE